MLRIITICCILLMTVGNSISYSKTSSIQKDNESAKTVNKNAFKTIILNRVTEPNEQAFSILIPKGWKTEGGIIRINPTAQGGAAQSIGAKLDFIVKRDDEGSVALHWLPEILYYDPRRSPAGQMGLFPIGSNYNGMPVYPVMSAVDFLTQGVFPLIHQNASNVQLIEKRQLPDLIESYKKRLATFAMPVDFSYDAAVVTVTYQENGKEYKEKLITVIEDMGQIGTGMWGNKETFLFRAPINEFDGLESIASIIQDSVKINPQWMIGELRGQIQRGEMALQTQQYINEINKQIVEHRQNTYAQIRNDMYLNLTSQEEYVNPYTNEVELGSNEWKNRWTNGSGDVVYSDDPNYNPNRDDSLKRTDYKISQVKPRK
jgi:hypothetical protein